MHKPNKKIQNLLELLSRQIRHCKKFGGFIPGKATITICIKTTNFQSPHCFHKKSKK